MERNLQVKELNQFEYFQFNINHNENLELNNIIENINEKNYVELKNIIGNKIIRKHDIYYLNLENVSSFDKIIVFIYINKIDYIKKLIEEEHSLNFTELTKSHKTLLMLASELNRHRIVKYIIDIYRKSNLYIKKQVLNISAFNLALKYIESHNNNNIDFLSFYYLFPYSNMNKNNNNIEFKEFSKFLNGPSFTSLVKKYNPLLNRFYEIDEILRFKLNHIKIDSTHLIIVPKIKNLEFSHYLIFFKPNFENYSSDNLNYFNTSNNIMNEYFYYFRNLSSQFQIDYLLFSNFVENCFTNLNYEKLEYGKEIDLIDDQENFDNLRGKKAKIIFRVFESEEKGKLVRELKNILIVIDNNINGSIRNVCNFVANLSTSNNLSSVNLDISIEQSLDQINSFYPDDENQNNIYNNLSRNFYQNKSNSFISYDDNSDLDSIIKYLQSRKIEIDKSEIGNFIG